MSGIASFKDLDAWKVAMDRVVMAYRLIARLSPDERYELSAQLRKAAVSVPSNVAEGQGYGKGPRYLHHVRIALCSLAELETQFEVARRLRLLPEDDLSEVEDQIQRTGQLLHGLARSLRRQQMRDATIAGSAILIMCLFWL
jgi:four helix bundle protein